MFRPLLFTGFGFIMGFLTVNMNMHYSTDMLLNNMAATFALFDSNEDYHDQHDDETKNQHNDSNILVKHQVSNHLDELNKLTGGGEIVVGKVECHWPKTYFHNRVIHNESLEVSRTRLIPKILHISMNSRCLPQDLTMIMERWKSKLPTYSIFFHDDDAVQKLIEEDWPEFPGLHSAIKCVISKGAMLIDVWRLLILWKFGGVYTDIDNWPEDKFTEDLIPDDVSAFFFPDAFNRPSQWFMALEPHHPIIYDTITLIIQNLYNLPSIYRPKVVSVTGPAALKMGYAWFFPHLWQNGSDVVFQNNKVLIGRFGKSVYKLKNKYRGTKENIYLTAKKGYLDIVPFNETLNVTRSQRIEMESGLIHWQQEARILANPEVTPRVSCKEYLKLLAKNKNNTMV